MKIDIRLESFTGFYQGIWSSDDFLENSMESIECDYGALEHKYDWEISDRAEWEDHFALQYAEAFFELVEEYLELQFKVVSASVWSPKEYNFATDEIDCEAEIADGWRSKLVALMDEHREELVDIIRNNHTSCDRFWSFMENDFDEWRSIISGEKEDEDEMLYVSCSIVYLLLVKSDNNLRSLNEAIALDLADDYDIWYPAVSPWSVEAKEEWEEVKEEHDKARLKRDLFNACPCILGLEEYQ